MFIQFENALITIYCVHSVTGETCYMSSCSCYGGTKWYLHRKTVANCRQFLPGGHQSVFPNHDAVLFFDEPFLSDLDNLKASKYVKRYAVKTFSSSLLFAVDDRWC